MDIGHCRAGMKHCNNFDPEVQIEIEHNNQSARFTCTNNNCDEVSPATSAPETTTTTTTTTTMTTVVNSMPYCETTHTTTPSPVTGHTSPTMCTPATTVTTSVPYCETTHTTTPSPVTGHTSPAMCTLATITTTVTTSVPYCETTHTTHSCEITITPHKNPLINLLVMPQCACVEAIW